MIEMISEKSYSTQFLKFLTLIRFTYHQRKRKTLILIFQVAWRGLAPFCLKTSYIKVISIVPGGATWRAKKLEVEDLISVSQGKDGDPVNLVDMRVDDAVAISG